MASVFVSEDELELVGLVRLNTISGKNQSSNGAVKDHIYAKHRMALEMDRVSQTFYGKLLQIFGQIENAQRKYTRGDIFNQIQDISLISRLDTTCRRAIT